jgi:chromosome segregation ATPase
MKKTHLITEKFALSSFWQNAEAVAYLTIGAAALQRFTGLEYGYAIALCAIVVLALVLRDAARADVKVALEAANEEYDALQAQTVAKQAQIESQNSQIQSQSSDIVTLRAANDAQIEFYDSQIAIVKKQVIASDSQIAVLTGALSASETQISQLEKLLDDAGQSEILAAKYRAIYRRVEALDWGIEQFESYIFSDYNPVKRNGCLARYIEVSNAKKRGGSDA